MKLRALKQKTALAWQRVRPRAKEIGGRALHTWWQAFGGVVAVTWAASGLDVSQVNSVDAAKRFALAAAGAVFAAALSAAKTTVAAIRKDPAAYVGEHTAPPTP